ncbi:AT-hook motif nuclear-localized protein 1 [Ziziphus jujuba]|uniref:AT-hook motif nuclear-localized protein n=1 Tax=Ziziphus jujuba TaxID=326968 RepID=A0A6P3ZIR2_ZIZJJ|nr:AT-hook motif nuclear-localized protein 1 [Ziziphus jujuba]
MEQKNGSVSGSPVNTETEHLRSENPEKGINQEQSHAVGGEGVGGDGVSTGTDMATRRKRGRPRKYDVEADMVRHVSPPPPVFSSSSAFSECSFKRGRGRPRGSGKLQLLASLGGFAADTAGGSFVPHVVNVQTGEDIFRKITSFSQKGPRAICILSATGVVSSVIIRQPGSSGGFLRHEGRFEILSLSGSFVFGEMSGTNKKNGMLSISLAKPDGRVFGGGVAGSLIAAGPTQLIIGSFKQDISKELKRRCPTESSSAASLLNNSELVRVPIQVARTINGDENCVTPRSALLEPSHGGAINVISGNQRMNNASLHNVGLNALQASEAMPDQKRSPDINNSLPQF